MKSDAKPVDKTVCCTCGQPAIKGYNHNGKRYCDPCYEHKLRIEAAEQHDQWDSRFGPATDYEY